MGSGHKDIMSSSYAGAVSSTGTFSVDNNNKPFILLVGTANSKKSREDKLKRKSLLKRTAFTISNFTVNLRLSGIPTTENGHISSQMALKPNLPGRA